MRDDIWLKVKLDSIWEMLFPEVIKPNNVNVLFKGKSLRRFGCIKKKKKDSIIEINSLFRDERVPEYIIDITLAHELVHYSHGFNSPLPKKYQYPHKGGIVDKELIKRGFGGSMMNEVLHYSDRIVLPYKPRAILLYEGDNDIGKGIDKKYILNAFTSFVSKVHTKLPECRIYIISVKPSIKREALWPKQQQLNSKLKVLCKTNEKLFYLDIASVLLNEDGSINKDMFIEDMLHLNERGYKAWNSVIRPTLIKHELKYEK